MNSSITQLIPALPPPLDGALSLAFGFTRETVLDIGRDWREERAIEKQIVDSVSV
jgi:hypothetical protein